MCVLNSVSTMKKIIITTLVLGIFAPTAKSQVSDQGVGGAILGAIAGGIIGHNNGRKGWEGALIGTGAGLLAGEIIGGDNRSYTSHSSYPHRSYYSTYPHRSHYSRYPHRSHYSSYRPSYSYNRYHDTHHCPPARVVREVVERPVYIHSSQSSYLPQAPSRSYYPQSVVIQQQSVVIQQQPVVIQQQPVVIQQQPVVVQQPVYIPQVTLVQQGGYRVTY